MIFSDQMTHVSHLGVVCAQKYQPRQEECAHQGTFVLKESAILSLVNQELTVIALSLRNPQVSIIIALCKISSPLHRSHPFRVLLEKQTNKKKTKKTKKEKKNSAIFNAT